MKNPENFWQWFTRNELFLKDKNHPEREDRADELLQQLKQFSEELWFEMGVRPDGSGHLIISAEGNLDGFSDVRALVSAAPSIQGWEITAFKPPRGFGFVLKRSGITINPKHAWFVPLEDPEDPEFFGIEVGYLHYDSEKHEDFLDSTYIMLEAGIGELALAEQIHQVDVGLLPDSPESNGYIAVENLAQYLAEQAPRDNT